jgi:hypothetical protein
MDSSERFQRGLEKACRKLHEGRKMRLSIGYVDANTMTAFRRSIEDLYRSKFDGEELIIEEMQKDASGMLHMILAKK